MKPTAPDIAKDELKAIQTAVDKLTKHATRGTDLTASVTTLRAVRMRLSAMLKALETGTPVE